LTKVSKDKNPSLTLLIQDGVKFVKKFQVPISTSAPHIYISALPQTPSNSLIRERYLSQSSHFLCVKGGAKEWDEELISVHRASLFHDGTRIAAIFADKTLRIITLETGEEICTPFVEGAWEVAVSRDGKLVATVGSMVLCLRKAETGEEIERYYFNTHPPLCPPAFSPDGMCIAVGRQSNVYVFHVDTGKVLSTSFKGHQGDVNSVAHSPYGTQIVSCSEDKTVRVWDASNGSLIKTFDGHTGWNTVSFSPNGTQIAAGSAWDGVIELWTVKMDNSRRLTNGGAVFSLAFSQDGQFLVAVSYQDIHVYDLSTTPSSPKLVGYYAARIPTSVAFFPDGKQILSTSNDGTVRVWDGDELEKVCTSSHGGYGDGWWVLGKKSELLLWTLSGVRDPRNTFIVGPHVDLLHFVHGEEWIHCRKPLREAM
jgi:WD40 repeat protein